MGEKMDKSTLISFIVPIYNTDQYLSRCIDSIIRQTYENKEIILVDDGSTDQSGIICNEYVRRYSFVKYVYQKNEGQLKARKTGLKMAKGTYVSFVDSDDWIEDNYCEIMLSSMDESVDLVGMGCTVDNENGVKGYMKNALNEGVYEGENLKKAYTCIIYDFNAANPGILQSVCAKIFKRKKLRELMQGIEERFPWGEDAVIVYNYILGKTEKIVLLNETLYHYCVRETSVVNSANCDTYLDIYRFYCFMLRCLEKYPLQWNLKNQLQAYQIELLNELNRKVYGIGMRPYYFLNGNSIRNYNKIILYGAGNVGKDYYEQIREEKCDVVEWIDNGKVINPYDELKIVTVDNAKFANFDVIVIAIANEQTAKHIKEELKRRGICAEKILWIKPIIKSGVFRIVK